MMMMITMMMKLVNDYYHNDNFYLGAIMALSKTKREKQG